MPGRQPSKQSRDNNLSSLSTSKLREIAASLDLECPSCISADHWASKVRGSSNCKFSLCADFRLVSFQPHASDVAQPEVVGHQTILTFPPLRLRAAWSYRDAGEAAEATAEQARCQMRWMYPARALHRQLARLSTSTCATLKRSLGAGMLSSHVLRLERCGKRISKQVLSAHSFSGIILIPTSGKI
eukprot:1730888-Pleurochrysis_carterae.AAC.2